MTRATASAAFLFALAAILSTGYHHPDEHFQILEYVALKLGSGDSANMAWEFHHRMRGWMQPGVLFVVAGAMRAVGLDEAWQWATAFRLLSAALTLASLFCFARSARAWFSSSTLWRWFVATLYFFWCVPYLAVRASSESWSSSFFLFGLCVLFEALKSEARRERLALWLSAGFLWGLAFEFRYQVAILVAAAVFHSVFVPRRYDAFLTLPGVALAIVVGLFVDRWGYGVWTVAPWNYFDQNLVAGKVAEFGVSPWWAYFKLVPLKLGPPLGLLLMAGTVCAWIRFPFHVLTWSSFAFFLVHSAIGHKEGRFLIPLLAPAIALNFLWLQSLRFRPGRFVRIGLAVLLAANGALCLVSLVKPADVKSDFYAYLSRKKGERVRLFYQGSHPYGPVSKHKFYWFPGLSFHAFETVEDFRAGFAEQATLYLFVRGHSPPDWIREPGLSCTKEYASIPGWVRPFDVNGWLSRTPAIELYRCRRAAAGAEFGPPANRTRQKKC